MKLLQYHVHNVLGVKDAKLDVSGRHLYLIGGRNDQGKTSAITALLIALCGRRGCDYPDIPLRDGEDEGSVLVELDGDETMQSIRVIRKFQRRRDGSVKELLVVTDVDGTPAPEPQTVLNTLYKAKGFDPLAFLSLNKRGKTDAIEKMLGLDSAAFRQEESDMAAERKALGKQRDVAEASVRALPYHPDAPDDEVSVSELLQSLDEARKENAERKKVIARADSTRNHLADLRAKLAEIRQEIDSTGKELKEYEKAVDNVPPIHDIDALNKQIELAEETNRKVRENQNRKDAEAAADKLSVEFSEAEDAIIALRADWARTLREAKWPIGGLSLDATGLLYNGLPFEQASRSVQIRVAVRMAMAQNPTLKLMVCQNGNDLDNDAMAELETALSESDYQMLLEVVTRSDSDEERCQVVFENGEAK